MPYSAPDITVYEKEEFQQIPPEELSVRRGTRVEVSDGYVGKVDEFVVHLKTGHITHLVMREDIVFLKLTKHEIEALLTLSCTDAGLDRWGWPASLPAIDVKN